MSQLLSPGEEGFVAQTWQEGWESGLLGLMEEGLEAVDSGVSYQVGGGGWSRLLMGVEGDSNHLDHSARGD